MRSSFEQSDYTKPGEEFSPPPEQSATLFGGSRFADGFGARKRSLAEPDEAERQAAEVLAEEGPAGEAPGEELTTSAASSGASGDAAQAAGRKEKRKRSLLLQFAAVASSVVLVTNSFGIDLLGMDGLFNDSVIMGEVSDSATGHYDEPTHDSEPEITYGETMAFGGDKTFPRLVGEWTVTQDATVDAHNRYIVTADFTKGEMNDRAKVEGFVRADRKTTGYSGPIDIAFPDSLVMVNDPSITYDENSNTLTLRNYHGKGLIVNNMGPDFTIRLEGDNVLSQYLLVGGGSLTLTGEGGITINEKEEFRYGIHLDGGFSEAYLMIDNGVKFDIGGKHSVFRVSETYVEKAMWQISPMAWQNTYQGRLAKEDISRYPDDPNRYYSWLLCGSAEHSTIVHLNNGYHPGGEDSTGPVETAAEPSSEAPAAIVRMSVGGDNTFPILPNPLPNSVGADGQVHASEILVWDNYSGGTLSGDFYLYHDQQNNPSGRDDISYDPSANTLTLNNFHGGRLDIRSMGNSFKIKLVGKNELLAGIQIFGDLTSGSVTFTGDGYLELNSAGSSQHGIYLDGGEAPACVMIDRDVIMDIYGGQAITVWNTSTDKGIWYLSDAAISGVLQEQSDIGYSSVVNGNICDWRTVDEQGNPATHLHIGGEVPADPESTENTEPEPELQGLPVGGDSSFPSLPNPNPNTPVPGSGVTNEDFVQVFDALANDWDSFIYWNPEVVANIVTQEGISYNRLTNTLTLNNYHGIGLAVKLLGNSFTVELIGENELTQNFYVDGYYTGGSIRFTGSGSLTINSGRTENVGLHLLSNFSTSCVMIDSGVSLDIYGEQAAIQIINTNAEKGIYLKSDSPLSNVRQCSFVSPQSPGIDGVAQGPYYIWTVTGNDGTFLKHVEIGGGGSSSEPVLGSLQLGGDSAFPDLPNLAPNSPVPGAVLDGSSSYYVLDEDYIQVFDRNADQWEFVYVNRNQPASVVTKPGLTYNRNTNTLTLNNYRGAGISANLLGNSFTVELIGENVLTQDFMVWGFYTGGSIRFTGSGSLSINSSMTSPYGLYLECEFSESCVMIEDSVTLNIYGKEKAVLIDSSSHGKGFYLKSSAPYPGVNQAVISQTPADMDVVHHRIHRTWTLVDSTTGYPLTHFRFEGSKGNSR